MTLTDPHTSNYIRLFCLTLKDCLDMGPKHIHTTISHSDWLRLYGVLATLSVI